MKAGNKMNFDNIMDDEWNAMKKNIASGRVSTASDMKSTAASTKFKKDTKTSTKKQKPVEEKKE